MRKPCTPSVCVRLVGGLGNQLFGLAAGLRWAREQNSALELDVAGCLLDPMRGFELGHLDLESAPVPLVLTGYYTRSRVPTIARAVTRGRRRLKRRVVHEAGLAYQPDLLMRPPGYTIAGFLQDYRYVEPVIAHMRPMLRRRQQRSARFESNRGELHTLQPYISVHIRGGDYRYSTQHTRLDSAYYQRALRFFSDHDVNIVVFTDDARDDEVECLLGTRPRYVVRSCVSDPAIDDLELMSLGSGIITANSTYSWWAAMFGSEPGFKAVLPQRWLEHESGSVERLIRKDLTAV